MTKMRELMSGNIEKGRSISLHLEDRAHNLSIQACDSTRVIYALLGNDLCHKQLLFTAGGLIQVDGDKCTKGKRPKVDVVYPSLSCRAGHGQR